MALLKLVVDSCLSSFLKRSRVYDPALETSRLVVRSACADDLEGVAEVLTQSFHPPQGFLGWMSPFLKLGICEDLRSRLRSNTPYYACLVASIPAKTLAETKIAGTVEIALRTASPWSANREQYLYISNLAVISSYRRQGIAQKLLLKCDQLALEWGFQHLSLHVLENNFQARQLYSKSGYQLSKTETSLWTGILKRPRRLLLSKRISR